MPHGKMIFYKQIKPQRSLTHRGFCYLICGLGALGLIISTAFLLMGAWPVLGFMIIDVLLVYLVFQLSFQAADNSEKIEVFLDKINIWYFKGNDCVDCIQLNPYWTKAQYKVQTNGRSFLRLISHGSKIEIGKFLNSRDKKELAQQLDKCFVSLKS